MTEKFKHTQHFQAMLKQPLYIDSIKYFKGNKRACKNRPCWRSKTSLTDALIVTVSLGALLYNGKAVGQKLFPHL